MIRLSDPWSLKSRFPESPTYLVEDSLSRLTLTRGLLLWWHILGFLRMHRCSVSSNRNTNLSVPFWNCPTLHCHSLKKPWTPSQTSLIDASRSAYYFRPRPHRLYIETIMHPIYPQIIHITAFYHLAQPARLLAQLYLTANKSYIYGII